DPKGVGGTELEAGAVRRRDPLFEAEIEHAPQERRAVDRLQHQDAAPAADELRHVQHRALERGPIAARDREASEDDRVVEAENARRAEAGQDVALLEANEPRRDEGGRLAARGLDGGPREVD